MKDVRRKTGFSLIEVLMAMAILSVGLIFSVGTFSAGIRYTQISNERTIAAVASDEAFAKIKLYGLNFSSINWPLASTDVYSNLDCVDFNDVSVNWFNPNEYGYPSIGNGQQKEYYWRAVCRKLSQEVVSATPIDRLVQVTVFVYRERNPNVANYSRPIEVSVSWTGSRELLIGNVADKMLINDGYTIVDDETGQIYRVLERYVDDTVTPGVDESRVVLLDRDWEGLASSVWVTPPAVDGGRYPCIGVYQKIIRF